MDEGTGLSWWQQGWLTASPLALHVTSTARAVLLELSRCHQPYLSSSAGVAQLRVEPLCCHPLWFSSNHSWPRSCQEQLEVWISSPVFRTETVGAAQGRAQSWRLSEVLAVPVNTSCTQAGLSSHFVFQGRSLSEEVLWFCVTEQCVLACVREVVFGAAPAIDLGPGLFCGVLFGLGGFETAREIPAFQFLYPWNLYSEEKWF